MVGSGDHCFDCQMAGVCARLYDFWERKTMFGLDVVVAAQAERHPKIN